MFSQVLESWFTGFSRNCCYSSYIWAINFRFHQQYLHFFHGDFNRCVATSKNVFLGKLIDFLIALQSNKANNAEKCVVCTDFSLYCKSYFSKTTFIFFFKVTEKTQYFRSTMRTKLIYFFLTESCQPENSKECCWSQSIWRFKFSFLRQNLFHFSQQIFFDNVFALEGSENSKPLILVRASIWLLMSWNFFDVQILLLVFSIQTHNAQKLSAWILPSRS